MLGRVCDDAGTGLWQERLTYGKQLQVTSGKREKSWQTGGDSEVKEPLRMRRCFWGGGEHCWKSRRHTASEDLNPEFPARLFSA